MTYEPKKSRIHAKALNANCTFYREVCNGAIHRSVISVKRGDEEYFVSANTLHGNRPLKYTFKTQKEVSQFTADYFGL